MAWVISNVYHEVVKKIVGEWSRNSSSQVSGGNKFKIFIETLNTFIYRYTHTQINTDTQTHSSSFRQSHEWGFFYCDPFRIKLSRYDFYFQFLFDF